MISKFIPVDIAQFILDKINSVLELFERTRRDRPNPRRSHGTAL
jgi:hypothetical protein